jgi:hypothetical protein
MGAFDTLPRPRPGDPGWSDPRRIRELAGEALDLDPDDWHPEHAAAHLRTEHPQVTAWPDDNPYQAHEVDHRDWIYDHLHRSRLASREAAFTQLNPDFGVLPDYRDPGQHRFAADREQALALGTRVAEGLRAHNHPDPQRRERAIAGVAVEAKFRAAGYDHPTRQETRRAAEPAKPRPLPQRSAPERARVGPER